MNRKPRPRSWLFKPRKFKTPPAFLAKRVFCPIAGSDYGYAKQHGATITWGGAYVPRERLPRPALDTLLPYAARSVVTPLRGDLIPETSHGASLFHLCEQTYWDSIRVQVFAARGNRCEICGIDGVMECHEVWDYTLGAKVNAAGQRIGSRRLTGFMSVCPACHKMFHLGFASSQGQFDTAADRLMEVNRWSVVDLDMYVEWQINLREYRADTAWTLDLSFITSYGPLVAKPGSRFVCGRNDGAIICVNDKPFHIFGTRIII